MKRIRYQVVEVENGRVASPEDFERIINSLPPEQLAALRQELEAMIEENRKFWPRDSQE